MPPTGPEAQAPAHTGVIRIHIDESPVAVAADAAEMFMHLAQQAVEQAGVFRVALSGGSTPRLLYGLLASDTLQSEVPWQAIEFFFGDERWVPPTSKESNYKLANDELFSKVPVAHSKIFPVPTESITPDQAAAQYEATIQAAFNIAEGQVPEFDLIFLGMGDEGHTASLFPGSPALHERQKLVAAPYVEKLSSPRITLTPPALQNAKQVVMLVTGEGKATALKEVLEGEYNPDEYPSQLLRQARGTVSWHVDRAAASLLDRQYAMGE